MKAGALDRRIQFLRAALVDDGLQSRSGDFVALGSPVWASRRDVSDAENAAAGQERGTLSSRFVCRSSAFTRGITSADRFSCDGLVWLIQGIKEVEGRAGLEITAVAKVS